MRTTLSSLVSLSLLLSTGLLGTACGPASNGSGEGGGGAGGTGAGGQLPAGELIGDVLELTAPSIDVVGVPSIAANTDRWAVQWVDRGMGYPEGGVTLVGEGGDVIKAVVPLAGSEGAIIHSALEPSSFGALTGSSAQPTYDTAFAFKGIGPSGEISGEGLTDYSFDAYSVDLAPIGDEWVVAICNSDSATYRLHAAQFGKDVQQSPFAPIDIDPVASAAAASCDDVHLMSTGQAVWAVFTGRLDGEKKDGVFLQRLSPPSDLVRVTDPGVEAGNPHLLLHGDEMIVEHWHAASNRRAIRRYDLEGQPLGDAIELDSGRDMGDNWDAAMVGDHVAIGAVGGGAVVRSFALDGSPVTGELRFGPQSDSEVHRPAVAALGGVLGFAYVGVDENYRYRMYFGRVGGL